MTKTSRISHLISGLLGGAVVALAGVGLVIGGVLETGDDRPAAQPPAAEQIADQSGGGSGDGEGASVSEIYEQVGPGVVFIQATGVSGDSPFGLPQREGQATGTGFVLDEEGRILTNAHVVEGAREVEVRLGDEDSDLVKARVVGRDPSSDLALLDVEVGRDKLTPLELGDSSKVEVGQPTIAIGNPFGYERTVTTGIISAVQRQIQAPNEFSIDNVIQTDAAVNPGNSGGPLLDADGRVIGINSQIATGGGNRAFAGIAFAVPINTAKEVIPQLEQGGEVKRAYLGVETAPAKTLAEELKLPSQTGALVQRLDPQGPAAKAGLRGGRDRGDGLFTGGDLIVKIDGQDVADPESLARIVTAKKPGDKVRVEYFRGRERKTATVTLGERPDESRIGERDAEPEGPQPGEPTPP